MLTVLDVYLLKNNNKKSDSGIKRCVYISANHKSCP